MKKILLGILVLVVLLAGAAAFLIATFDVNQYKPMIEKKLTEAAGNPVTIGSIGLGWGGTVILEVKDIVIREEGRSALTVKRAAAGLDVWALLAKRISVPSVEVIEPQFVILKDASGVQIGGVRPPTASAAKPAKAAGKGTAALPVDLSIRSVRLRDARVTYVDQSGPEPVTVQVRDLDADVQNLALGSEIRFGAKASVFSDIQNLELAGKTTVRTNGSVEAKDVTLRTDLARLDWKALSRSVPAARDLPFKKYPVGVVTLKVPVFKMAGGSKPAAPEYTVQLDLSGGALALRDFRPDITGIQLSAQVDPRVASVKSFSASLAGGSVNGAAEIRDWAAARQTTVQLEAKALRIESMLPLTKSGKTQFEGELGAAFTGGFTGFEWGQIQKNLNGKAVLDLPKGVLLNMNLVREVLGKLDSLFPGAVASVEQRLPAGYKTKLTEQSTVLNPFRHTFEIVNGVVYVRDLVVATDFFSAGTSGDLSLEGTYEGRGSIQMDKTFSKAMFEGVPALSVLANAVSQVELPLKLRYRNGKFSALPDLDEIGRRIIPQSGGQLLQQVLGAASSAQGSGSAGVPTSNAGAPSGSSGGSTGGWLGQIQSIVGSVKDSQQ